GFKVLTGKRQEKAVTRANVKECTARFVLQQQAESFVPQVAPLVGFLLPSVIGGAGIVVVYYCTFGGARISEIQAARLTQPQTGRKGFTKPLPSTTGTRSGTFQAEGKLVHGYPILSLITSIAYKVVTRTGFEPVLPP